MVTFSLFLGEIGMLLTISKKGQNIFKIKKNLLFIVIYGIA